MLPLILDKSEVVATIKVTTTLQTEHQLPWAETEKSRTTIKNISQSVYHIQGVHLKKCRGSPVYTASGQYSKVFQSFSDISLEPKPFEKRTWTKLCVFHPLQLWQGIQNHWTLKLRVEEQWMTVVWRERERYNEIRHSWSCMEGKKWLSTPVEWNEDNRLQQEG